MKNNLTVTNHLLCALALATVASTAQAAGVPGAIFTTTSNGTIVNENQFSSKCAVYLDGGPGPRAPAKAAGLPDGDYYFQVTDPSGAVLLSTDPVSNRKFQVTGGVITAFTGTGGAAHPTAIDQDHAALGAKTIQLANTSCPTDYLNSPNTGNVYKVWATPVGSFVGNPANVDSPCTGGCSHGFVASQSKTDNFKAQPAASATFCLTMQKQFDKLGDGSVLFPVEGWVFSVTDPSGVTNTFVADVNGTASACQLGAGAYTVTEDINDPLPHSGCLGPYRIISSSLNGGTATTSTSVTFNWSASSPSVMTVSFVNGVTSCFG